MFRWSAGEQDGRQGSAEVRRGEGGAGRGGAGREQHPREALNGFDYVWGVSLSVCLSLSLS